MSTKKLFFNNPEILHNQSQLCNDYAGYMIENAEKDKDGAPIDDAVNWFYKIMGKKGYYYKPNNFKTYEEKALEHAKKRLKEKQDRMEVLEKILNDEKEAELSIKLHEVLKDRNGDLFKQCLKQFSGAQENKTYGPQKSKRDHV